MAQNLWCCLFLSSISLRKTLSLMLAEHFISHDHEQNLDFIPIYMHIDKVIRARFLVFFFHFFLFQILVSDKQRNDNRICSFYCMCKLNIVLIIFWISLHVYFRHHCCWTFMGLNVLLCVTGSPLITRLPKIGPNTFDFHLLWLNPSPRKLLVANKASIAQGDTRNANLWETYIFQAGLATSTRYYHKLQPINT